MRTAADDCTIRTMTRDEIAIAVDWAAAEGWNPGLHDADCFHAADGGGFLIGVVDGEPVATISVVRYGSDFGFLGFYIVRPDFRGQGCGLRIWQAGMQHLAGRVVGLDGVVAQQANYARSGFTLAWRNVRHEGEGGGTATTDAHIVPASSVPIADLIAFDARYFSTDRNAFLRCWIAQPDATALAWTDGTSLRGWGMVRPCRAGWKIGPLFAEAPVIAESLYAALAARTRTGDKIYLDVPEPNAEGMALARRHGMRVVFETARMYTGTAPPLPLRGIYGITSFELG